MLNHAKVKCKYVFRAKNDSKLCLTQLSAKGTSVVLKLILNWYFKQSTSLCFFY